jgi:hypothetical protein
MGTWRDLVEFWRNTGSAAAPAWTRVDTALVTLTRGSNTTPTLGDLDGDGDLDLIVGEASGQLNYFRNTGTPTAPRFELVSDELGFIDVGRRSAPLLVDLDGDGRLDLLVGSETGAIRQFRPTGSLEAPFEGEGEPYLQSPDGLATIAIGDLFGTGRPELLLGGAGGGVRWFHSAPHPSGP